MHVRENGIPLSRPDSTTSFSSARRKTIMDLGFYKIPSIRGFTYFLVIVESRYTTQWAYLRQSKHPPIELCLWFTRMARQVLGFSVTIVRTEAKISVNAFSRKRKFLWNPLEEKTLLLMEKQKEPLVCLEYRPNSCYMQLALNPFSGALLSCMRQP
jgi:hypothetical protein